MNVGTRRDRPNAVMPKRRSYEPVDYIICHLMICDFGPVCFYFARERFSACGFPPSLQVLPDVRNSDGEFPSEATFAAISRKGSCALLHFPLSVSS